MSSPRGPDCAISGSLLSGGRLLESGSIVTAAGRVVWAGRAEETPDVGRARRVALPAGAVAVPGFVDLHVHGARGHDFADGTAEAIECICAAHAARGTTALCATVLTSPVETTLRALEAIATATTDSSPGGARVLGAHLEGPFLHPDKAGAQPREHLRSPDRGLLEEMLAAAGGGLRVMTLAPELPGALDLVERLVDEGVVVAMGHSTATYQQAQRAIDAGCRLTTHTFNAMSGLHHREPGLVGASLHDGRVICDVIADGHHVALPVLELLWRLKGGSRRQMALISDCTAALDAQPGRARLGERQVTVRDGAVWIDRETLAGSVLTLDRAVQRVAKFAPWQEVVAAASTVPAALAEACEHALVPGSRADLVVLDLQTLRVLDVWIGGEPLDSRIG